MRESVTERLYIPTLCGADNSCSSGGDHRQLLPLCAGVVALSFKSGVDQVEGRTGSP